MRHGLRLALAGLLFLGLAAPLAVGATPEPPLAGAAAKASGLREGTCHGYRRVSFTLEGHAAWVTFPKTPAPGKPWVWRARFPGYHDEIDLALLKRGFHTAHIDTANLYGSPRAMRLWDAFYALVTRLYGLNPRVSLYGCSRGGLFIYAFADRWPERVASIYGDTPVMDFTTWPEGKDGRGERSEADWARLKQVYGFTSDAEAEAWRGTGLHLAEKLARAHLPIWHTIGPEDAVVPPRHNTEPFAERFRAAGGEMAIHVNKGPYSLRGHHFPLDAVEKTADFIEGHAPLPDLSPQVMAAWFSAAAALRPARHRIPRPRPPPLPPHAPPRSADSATKGARGASASAAPSRRTPAGRTGWPRACGGASPARTSPSTTWGWPRSAASATPSAGGRRPAGRSTSSSSRPR